MNTKFKTIIESKEKKDFLNLKLKRIYLFLKERKKKVWIFKVLVKYFLQKKFKKIKI